MKRRRSVSVPMGTDTFFASFRPCKREKHPNACMIEIMACMALVATVFSAAIHRQSFINKNVLNSLCGMTSPGTAMTIAGKEHKGGDILLVFLSLRSVHMTVFKPMGEKTAIEKSLY